MNQGFKLRYDQLRENDPTSSENELNLQEAELYTGPDHSRNVCLVWPDGRRAFFNYAYLVAVEFEPNTEKNLIKLSFSSHHVALQGYSLQALFMTLLDHLPRIITATDSRYVLDTDRNKPIVIEMLIEKKEI
ncbi:hypothetical protein [Spirosoma endophyticum]|uniref:Uncharacterized protein n=1 Tax=Spirosoma endophyticum TaxID=662367 RepID=A0A1I2GCN5_9BACT|nr:hypothetical protein [Spirosoma endophyticum]SFF14879.1 hypothetical protein SAMN05216167_13117 [Spirosoma endophyticum]